MTTKKIYVDKRAVGTPKPPIVVEDGDQVYRGTSVKIDGPAVISTHKHPHISPDNQNVHVYIETDANVTIEN